MAKVTIAAVGRILISEQYRSVFLVETVGEEKRFTLGFGFKVDGACEEGSVCRSGSSNLGTSALFMFQVILTQQFMSTNYDQPVVGALTVWHWGRSRRAKVITTCLMGSLHGSQPAN
jgi:hypothetical protein